MISADLRPEGMLFHGDARIKALAGLPLRQLEAGVLYGSGDLLLFAFAEVVVEGQTQQSLAHLFGDRVVRGTARKLQSRLRKMKRSVVEDAENALRLQLRDQPLSTAPSSDALS